ncbi:hypothetical protein [Kineococcus rhizosphaerae]|uniref:AAA domain-containing protein n=1 Tax=Kineococcus rhizosphaerae TaxID=559628 RepID=A0A2T0QZL2_9ACTN|nr:hypothetical protein [Kineococcus rhizosphaerae]PRY12065.1 hypothetical protein CLV37_11121 [Kineococcus rhizosphaerae]
MKAPGPDGIVVPVLFHASGSSCAGKTTVLPALRRLPSLAVHDADELGVPSDADTAWRQSSLERWVRFALERQAEGVDLLLAGQSPLGELLACPSAPRLDGLAVCLLDVEDDVRLARLRARDGDRWDAAALDAFVGWGRWHRAHAADPRHHPEVVTTGGWAPMRWDRWSDWTAGDPRWAVETLDTTRTGPDAVAGRLAGWVTRRRGR